MKKGFSVTRSLLSFFAFAGINKERADKISYNPSFADVKQMILDLCVECQKVKFMISTTKIEVSVVDVLYGVAGRRKTKLYVVEFDEDIKKAIENQEAPASLYSLKTFIELNKARFESQDDQGFEFFFFAF